VHGARSSWLVGFVISLVASSALADETPSNAVLAQSLFEQGRTLMEQADFARACRALAESQRLDPGGGTLLNLALCHQKEGKLATAWAEFNEALSGALRDGRKDREELARESIEALKPELPRISVELAAYADARTEVRLDGAVLGPEARGFATPVDPGAHTVSASAPGRRAFSVQVSLAKGESRRVTIPALEPMPERAPVPAPTQPAPKPRPPPAPTRTRLSTGSYVSGGVALAAFGTAIATGLVALSAEHSAQGKCSSERNYCPDPSYADDASRAKTFAWVSTGALGVGLAASAAALFWPRQTVEAPVAAAPLAGFAWRGRF
jgi:hypothetical protein